MIENQNNPKRDTGKAISAKPEDLASSFSRDFTLFDLLPVVVVATVVSIALAGTHGGSKSLSFTRIVDSALAATPSSLVIWWFCVVGIAALARPVLRLLVAAARMDGTATGRVNATTRGRLGSAILQHAVDVGAASGVALVTNTSLLTLSELRVADPAAFRIVMDHRERWEVTLRLGISVAASGLLCAALLPVEHALVSIVLGLLTGYLLYRQAAAEFVQYSKVVLAALLFDPRKAASNGPSSG